MDPKSFASEFPNDNPALHGGVRWVCVEVTGPAVALTEPACAVVTEVGVELEVEAVGAVDAIVIEDLEPLASEGLEIVETSVLPPAPDDPFTILVCTLADVAVGAGAPYVASVLPALLLEGRLDEAVPGEAAAALRAAGIVDAEGVVTEGFGARTRAWRSLLRGTSDDFDACGGVMLDEWAADLLARLLGAPARATLLRRDLRERGVAAFGLAA